MTTSLNVVEDDIDWWEEKAKTKPIIGMDNFEKLRLKLVQNDDENTVNETESDRNFGRSGTESDETISAVNESGRTTQDEESEKLTSLKGKIYNDFKKLFTTND